MQEIVKQDFHVILQPMIGDYFIYQCIHTDSRFRSKGALKEFTDENGSIRSFNSPLFQFSEESNELIIYVHGVFDLLSYKPFIFEVPNLGYGKETFKIPLYHNILSRTFNLFSNLTEQLNKGLIS